MVDLEQFEGYLRDRRLKRVSIDSYMRDVAQFCRHIGAAQASDLEGVTEHGIRQYCECMEQKGLAPVSMQRKVTSIKRFFEYLCSVGQAACNPAAGVRLCRRCAPRARSLTEEQLETLLCAPDTRTASGIRDKAMFALINSTGIKVSELIALRVEDVRLEERRVEVSRQRLPVTLPIDDEAYRCLGGYLAARGALCPKEGSALFLNVYGGSITRQGVWKMLKKHADAAGVEGITLETMRRSFARRYVGAGRDVHALKDILGHSDISITRAYIRE